MSSNRLNTLDQVRGAVMVFMALDHTRFFFTNLTFAPESLEQTNLTLFLTRWITHLCAPGFFLLAGVAIFLHGSKLATKSALARYLLSRGVFLILLELTIVGFAWVFTPGYSFGGVIWALGWSFIFMAGVVYLPRGAVALIALPILVLHNLYLDDMANSEGGWGAVIWHALYRTGTTDIPGLAENYLFLFPIIPWMAMMMFGYAISGVFEMDASARKIRLIGIGLAMLALFAILRVSNFYGNPDTLWASPETSGLFQNQASIAKTLINFLNTEKYPPSLQYTLMTLGPILLWLGLSRADDETPRSSALGRIMILFGRVPLYFYLWHLYIIHLLALALGLLAGQPVAWIAFGPEAGGPRSPGFGFNLWIVYAMWLLACTILYGLCRHYAAYKATHRHWWLKYI